MLICFFSVFIGVDMYDARKLATVYTLSIYLFKHMWLEIDGILMAFSGLEGLGSG